MPEYRIDQRVLNIARNALLVDTNVLVAAFNPNEENGRKDYAKELLDEDPRPLLIPSVVVVETWGVLVGSKNARHELGHELLSWLNRPGRATLVPSHQADLQTTEQLIRGGRVDCVDAMLAELATNITKLCDLTQYLPIATFDTTDFLRIIRREDLCFRVWDMRSRDMVEL